VPSTEQARNDHPFQRTLERGESRTRSTRKCQKDNPEEKTVEDNADGGTVDSEHQKGGGGRTKPKEIRGSTNPRKKITSEPRSKGAEQRLAAYGILDFSQTGEKATNSKKEGKEKEKAT